METSAKAERDIEHASAVGSSALRAEEKVSRNIMSGINVSR
jgi:hypothetical protein